jgi:hypothetical protein
VAFQRLLAVNNKLRPPPIVLRAAFGSGTFAPSRRLFACAFPHGKTRGNAMLSTILIIVLILLLIGALPTWPYSAEWGYYPGGGVGLILVIVLILALMGRL